MRYRNILFAFVAVLFSHQDLPAQIQYRIMPGPDSIWKIAPSMKLPYELANRTWWGMKIKPPVMSKTADIFIKEPGDSMWHLVGNVVFSDPVIKTKFKARNRFEGAILFYYDFVVKPNTYYQVYSIYYPKGSPRITEIHKNPFGLGIPVCLKSNCITIRTENLEGDDLLAYDFLVKNNLAQLYLSGGTSSNTEAIQKQELIKQFIHTYPDSRFYELMSFVYENTPR